MMRRTNSTSRPPEASGSAEPEALTAARVAEQAVAARETALRYLAAAPRSQREVQRRLEQRGYDAAVAETTLRWLVERSLLDDADLAHRLADSLCHGRRAVGPLAARCRLTARGIEAETADQAVEAAYGRAGELAAARAAAAQVVRRLRGLDHRVAQRRLAASLERRGFDFETIRQVLSETPTSEQSP